MTYEVMDKSIEDDSDSDVEHLASKARRMSGGASPEQAMSGLSLNAIAASPTKPAKPAAIPFSAPRRHEQESEEEDIEDDDEDNPFADRNAVKTPHIEKSGMTWYYPITVDASL